MKACLDSNITSAWVYAHLRCKPESTTQAGDNNININDNRNNNDYNNNSNDYNNNNSSNNNDNNAN